MTPAKKREHDCQVWKSPIAFTVQCRCSFRRVIPRRQNALARAAKVKGAINEHDKLVEAEEND